MLYNGIDITVDLEVLRFWGAKIRAIVRTKAMYEFTLYGCGLTALFEWNVGILAVNLKKCMESFL